MKQCVWLGVMAIVALGIATWAHAAPKHCIVAYNDVASGVMVIACDPETTRNLEVKDTVKIKESKSKKEVEGC